MIPLISINIYIVDVVLRATLIINKRQIERRANKLVDFILRHTVLINNRHEAEWGKQKGDQPVCIAPSDI